MKCFKSQIKSAAPRMLLAYGDGRGQPLVSANNINHHFTQTTGTLVHPLESMSLYLHRLCVPPSVLYTRTVLLVTSSFDKPPLQVLIFFYTDLRSIAVRARVPGICQRPRRLASGHQICSLPLPNWQPVHRQGVPRNS